MLWILRRLRFLFGFTGSILCLVGIISVWWYYPQLIQKSEGLHSQIDEAFDHIEGRLQKVQLRVAEVNAATLVFRKNLDDWRSQNADSDETIRNSAGRLADRVRGIEDGLEVAHSLLQKAQLLQRFTQPFPINNQSTRLEELQTEVGGILQKVSDVADKLELISRQLVDSDGQAAPGRTLSKVVSEVVLVIQLLDTTETTLVRISERVNQADAGTDTMIATIQRDLWWGCSILSVLMFWIGIGQVSLAILSRKPLTKPESSA